MLPPNRKRLHDHIILVFQDEHSASKDNGSRMFSLVFFHISRKLRRMDYSIFPKTGLGFLLLYFTFLSFLILGVGLRA